MKRGSLLLICILDPDTHDFITLVEVELPAEEKLNKSTSKWTFEGNAVLSTQILK